MTIRQLINQSRKALDLLGVQVVISDKLGFLESLVLNRGRKTAVKYIKDARLALYQFTAGAPAPSGLSCRLTKDGLPAFLDKSTLDSIRSRDLLVIQQVLNLLRFSYLIEYKGEADLEAITAPSTCGFETGSYANLVAKSKLVIKDLSIVIDKSQIKFKFFHLSTKMGPLGLAISSAVNEYLHPMFSYVRNNVRKLDVGLSVRFMALDDIAEWGVDLTNLGEVPNSRECKTLRRLSEVDAPEGKVRLVALVDYWTQSALRPLHLLVINKLGVWFGGCDRTMNQLGRTLTYPPTGNRFHSFDLKGFTDRFPMLYQKAIVDHLLGEKFGNAWSKLLVGMAYQYKDKLVFYRAGQPMGAYTSWAICTLCHHLVVRVAGHNVYKHSNFDQYMILGDDLVIFDDRVATEYVRLIGVLGVEISWSKSLVSNDSYEFAKRLFVKGVEVSGLPWDQLFRVNNPLTVLGGFLADLVTRSAT
jgi:hypothetical protein